MYTELHFIIISLGTIVKNTSSESIVGIVRNKTFMKEICNHSEKPLCSRKHQGQQTYDTPVIYLPISFFVFEIKENPSSFGS